MKKKPSAFPNWLHKSPSLLCIAGFACLYLFSLAAGVPQAAAATAPGGQITDPVVRQVDLAQPAVVRIVTKLGARLAVQITSSSGYVNFPLDGGSYTLEATGSGAFISAH